MWYPREYVGALEFTIREVSLDFFFEFDQLSLYLVVDIALGGSGFDSALGFGACVCYDVALNFALLLHSLTGADELSYF